MKQEEPFYWSHHRSKLRNCEHVAAKMPEHDVIFGKNVIFESLSVRPQAVKEMSGGETGQKCSGNALEKKTNFHENSLFRCLLAPSSLKTHYSEL